jgi:hypothetical protein
MPLSLISNKGFAGRPRDFLTRFCRFFDRFGFVAHMRFWVGGYLIGLS